MDDLPAIYPFCVVAPHGASMCSVLFDDRQQVRVIFDGTDGKGSATIPTKEVYTLSSPQYLCTKKLVAHGENATGWDIFREGSQFIHIFTRHDTRPGYVDGKSMTVLSAEAEGRDLEASYVLLLEALPKLAERSTSEAERIKAGLRTALTILQLQHLL